VFPEVAVKAKQQVPNIVSSSCQTGMWIIGNAPKQQSDYNAVQE